MIWAFSWLSLCATVAFAQSQDGAVEDWPKVLFEIEADPEPAALAAGVHFPTSNETRCYLWRDVINNPGGIFLGVGTDQNYLMAGWARPDVLILMDFDQLVVDLHLIYRVVFLGATDPQSFMKMWSKQNAKAVIGLLEQALPDDSMRQRVVAAFKVWRRTIEIRLDNVRRFHKEQKVKTFLDDPEQYAYLADLFRNNRVVAIRGDLTGAKAMRGIADAAKRLKLPVRTLYLSNAERYFSYSDSFRQNILEMPFDERTMILRTSGLGSWKNGDPFYYLFQSGQDFLEWIRDPNTTAVGLMIPLRKPGKERFLYSIGGPPPAPASQTKVQQKNTDGKNRSGKERPGRRTRGPRGTAAEFRRID